MQQGCSRSGSSVQGGRSGGSARRAQALLALFGWLDVLLIDKQQEA